MIPNGSLSLVFGMLLAAGDAPAGGAARPLREVGSVRAQVFQHDNRLRHVAFSPDSRLAAFITWQREAGTSGNFLHTIHVCDPATNRELRKITPAEGGPLGALTFAPDNQTIAVVRGAAVQLWDAGTGARVRTLTVPAAAGLAFTNWTGLAFAADGKVLAAVGVEQRGIARGDIDPAQLTPLFALWDVATGKTLRHTRGRAGASYQLVGFGAGGKVLAWDGGALQSGSARLVDLTNGAVLFSAEPNNHHVGRVALSPDGKTCVWADTKYNEWAIHQADVATGKEIRRIEGHAGSTTDLAWSADGTVFASAGGGTIRIHDAATGKVLHTLHEDGHRVSCLAFAPDGKTLASGGLEGHVCVWDVASGTRRARLLGDRGWVESVAFAPNGRLLCAGRTYPGPGGEGIGEAFLWEMK